jgi:hypothetical protein
MPLNTISSGGLPTRPTRPGLGAAHGSGSPKAWAPQSWGSPRFAGSVAPKGWCPQSLEVPKGRGPKDWRPHGFQDAFTRLNQ